MITKILTSLVGLQLVLGAVERAVIFNEDYLIGTCTGTCSEVPILHGKSHLTQAPHNCDTVKNCRLSSAGWNRGFRRCDYCKCTCVMNAPARDVKVVNKPISIEEPDLYDTCTGTCHKNGLVRTDFEGCHEVRDCRRSEYGWLRGFVRCDYCQCRCINNKYPEKYTLKNVRYVLNENAIRHDKPSTISETVIENCSSKEQEIARKITYEVGRSISVETTESLSTGTALTVEASARSIGPGFVLGVLTSIEQDLVTGFSTRSGSANTTTITDSQEATATIPAASKLEVKVIGHSMKIDVQYTADLVTTYTDGFSETRRTSGVFSGVETNQFRVQFGKFEPSSKCTQF